MPLPLIPIASIPTPGKTFPVGDWARGAAAEGVGGVVQSLEGEITLLRRGPHVLAQGHLDTVARAPCDRCGELLDFPVAGEFAVVYSPLDAIPPRAEDDDGGPEVPDVFAGEAEDVGEYQGDSLDLLQVVREFCALERPARLRCGDLDPAADAGCAARWQARAGVPLVDEVEAAPSPFAALKSLKPLS